MTETYYAGCYWLARPESVEADALRLSSFLLALSRMEPSWNRWHETAATYEEARELQVQTDAASLAALLGRKGNRILDSSSFSLWSGENPVETSAVHGSCGGSSAHVNSVCVLEPPAEGQVAGRILTAGVLTEVVRALVHAWEPEFGLATSQQHRDLIAATLPRKSFHVGWVMYFADFRGPVPPLPEPVRVEHIPDRGSLITLTQEKFTVSNPAHVALAADVQARLQAAGLLTPLRPWGT
jgi:hypothetical protein